MHMPRCILLLLQLEGSPSYCRVMPLSEHVLRLLTNTQGFHIICFFVQAGETRRKHEIRDFIDRGLAVAETERAKATLVSPTT
jgi:hypothetical protein